MITENTSRRIRTITVMISALVITTFASPLFAEPPGEADHLELRKMLATVTQAINERDFELLKPILAEPFALTMSDQVTVTNLAGLNEHYAQVFDSGKYPVTGLTVEPTATIPTRFLGDDIGYCFGEAVETYALKVGGSVILTSKWTATMIKVDGSWKLAAAHIGVHFMENPIVDALSASVQKMLYGGLLAGAIAGFLLARFLGRRKSQVVETRDAETTD